MKALLDENIPRSTAAALRGRGHDILEVCGSPLAGAPDLDIWKVAQDQGRVLITTDKGFAGYRDEPHCGILLIRLRRPSRAGIQERILAACQTYSDWRGLFLSVRDQAQMAYRSPQA